MKANLEKRMFSPRQGKMPRGNGDAIKSLPVLHISC